MCSINHDLKAVFIHVHKTGGTYISYMLHKYYGFKNYYLRRPDHDKFCFNQKKTTKYINYENRIHGVYMYYKTSPDLNRKMGMTPEKWKTYYKFAFVRNPYDKIVSAWFHVNRFQIPFKNFLNLDKFCNDVEYMHMFMPQTRNIINEKAKIELNFIGKFENLEEDFQKVLKNIGIKKIMHDPNKKLNIRPHESFEKYYTEQEVLDKVNKFLKEDFYLLDYPVAITIDEFKSLYGNEKEDDTKDAGNAGDTEDAGDAEDAQYVKYTVEYSDENEDNFKNFINRFINKEYSETNEDKVLPSEEEDFNVIIEKVNELKSIDYSIFESSNLINDIMIEKIKDLKLKIVPIIEKIKDFKSYISPLIKKIEQLKI
jgi:hypothetical protein